MKTFLVVVAVVLSACGGARPCSSTCTGCCDSAGVCQTGTALSACGSAGLTCSTCNLLQTCQLGVCLGGNGTGGGSGTGGGGAGGGSAGGTGGGQGNSVSQGCAQLYASECDLLARCGWATSSAACLRYFGLIFGQFSSGLCADYAASGADGRVTLNQSGLQQCVDSLSTLSCASGLQSSTPTGCANVFTGTVPNGGSCYAQYDCQRGHFCDSSASICPGQCHPQLADGQLASSSQQCVSSNTYDGRCAQPAALNASCAAVAPATSLRTCAVGAYCDSATQRCLALKPTGATCVGGGDCAQPNQCLAGACRPPAALTDTCSASSGGLSCRIGLRCDAPASGMGHCQNPSAAGGACGSLVDCVAGLVCDDVNGGVCRVPIPSGSPCQSTAQCGANLSCQGSGASTVCAPMRAAGQPCVDTECAAGTYCSNSVCTAFTCLDPTP